MSAYGLGATSPRRKEIIYRDLGLSFAAHPITKKVKVVENEEEIKRAVKNLVLTNKGERFYNPLYGGNVTAFLFENFDFTTEFDIKKSITNTINTYEPRVNLTSVQVDDDQDGNRLVVDIYFYVVGVPGPQQVQTFLQRVR